MKPSLLLTPVIIFLSAGPLRSLAGDEKPLHWYRLDLFTGGQTCASYYGSSPLDEAAFARQMEGTAFIRLDNMVYFDQNRKPKDWQDWSAYDEPRVFINPKDIIDFQPMQGDPRKLDATKK